MRDTAEHNLANDMRDELIREKQEVRTTLMWKNKLK